jgi:adenylate cyclase
LVRLRRVDTNTPPHTDEDTTDSQALRYAHDMARLNGLRRTYEGLVPFPIDPRTPRLPEARRRVASILFTDIRGSTAIGEELRLEPERLLEVWNEHFRVVVRAVELAGGRVEKFLGDGLMATFGVWDDLEDYSSHAVAAAISMIGGTESLNRRRAAIWGFPLAIGVGVATGLVAAGPLGPSGRRELTVLGDTVNIAARLTALAAGSEALLCATTYGAVSSRLQVRAVKETAVRGRTGTINLYRLPLGNTTA